MFSSYLHEFPDLVGIQKCWCPAAPVQLINNTISIEQLSLEFDLLVQMLKIGGGAGMITGYDLVAGAVKTYRVTERDVKVEGQGAGDRVLVAVLCPFPVVVYGDIAMELRCGRIGCIAWTALIIAAYQISIENQVLFHVSLLTGRAVVSLTWRYVPRVQPGYLYIRFFCYKRVNPQQALFSSPCVSDKLIWINSFPFRALLTGQKGLILNIIVRY